MAKSVNRRAGVTVPRHEDRGAVGAHRDRGGVDRGRRRTGRPRAASRPSRRTRSCRSRTHRPDRGSPRSRRRARRSARPRPRTRGRRSAPARRTGPPTVASRSSPRTPPSRSCPSRRHAGLAPVTNTVEELTARPVLNSSPPAHPVVSADPPPGAGRGVVADREVVEAALAPAAVPQDEHGGAVGRHRRLQGAITVVPSHPPLGGLRRRRSQ